MKRLTLLLGGLFALFVVAMAVPRPAAAASIPAGQAQALQLPNLTEAAQYYRRRYYRPRYYRPRYYRPRYYARPRYVRPYYARPRVVCRIRYTAWGPQRVCYRRW